MPALIQRLLDLAAEYALWLVAGSLLTIAIGIFLGPWLILRLPADYFTYRRRQAMRATRQHPAIHLLLTTAKNVAGAILVVAGLCLFFLPGQGIITLVAGLIVMNYPGKFQLERWLVSRPKVLPALNWLRRRYGRDLLQEPDGYPEQPSGQDGG
jgi:archaellum biogenesis protein FlaJ (TadC family)